MGHCLSALRLSGHLIKHPQPKFHSSSDSGIKTSTSTDKMTEETAAKEATVEEPTSQSVVIPDFFESFMSRTPTVNPYYHEVGEQAMEWISRVCQYSEEEDKRLHRADLAYFGAVGWPDARPDRYRAVTDWLNWIFPFDDVLDDGPLRDQKEEALKYIDGMAAVVNDTANSESDQYQQPSRYVLRRVWERMLEDPECSPGAQKRWAQHMNDYFQALRDGVVFKPSDNVEDTIERYIAYRFHSIAVTPMFSFIEYTCSLQIPEAVFRDESLMTIERVGVELQMLANDCISYHRERDLGCPHNIVHLFLHHGLTEQEAYDRIQDLIRERYRKWYLAHASLPIWGEEIDRQVLRYIKGVQDITLANANWSFRTQRYYGKHRQRVRETRIVEVAASKADWIPPIVPKTGLKAPKLLKAQL